MLPETQEIKQEFDSWTDEQRALMVKTLARLDVRGADVRQAIVAAYRLCRPGPKDVWGSL